MYYMQCKVVLCSERCAMCNAMEMFQITESMAGMMEMAQAAEIEDKTGKRIKRG